jgi:hypothetical protein
MSQTPASANNPRTARVLMFDVSLSWANFWYDAFNVTLFVGAFAVAVGTYGSIKMGAVKERFSDERTAALEAQTEQAKATLAIAQADIAKANESALKLQLLLNDEIRKNAWRRLSQEQHDLISEAVRRSLPMKVSMGFDGNDPEASMYASDLIKAFEDGGAVVNPQPSALFIGQMPVPGMIFVETKGFDSSAVQKGFASANIPFALDPSFRGVSGVSISLYVGHKPQAF